MPVGDIIERRYVAVLHRLRQIANEAPFLILVVRPDGVVRLAHIRPVTNGNEPLQVERHLLAADAEFHRARSQWTDPRDERLFEVERILVDRRHRILAERPGIFELREELEVRADTRIGTDLRALYHIGIGMTRADAEERRIVDLQTLAQIRAERQIRTWITAKRNVFKAIERRPAGRWVPAPPCSPARYRSTRARVRQ